MTSRERVLAVLNHKESDRIPIDLGSTRNTGIIVEAYKGLINYLGIEEKLVVDDYGFGKINRVAKPSEVVLKKLGIDLRGIFYGKPDRSFERSLDANSFQDEIGVLRTKEPGCHYYNVVNHPFSGDLTISKIKTWNWPDPDDPGYIRGLRNKAQRIRQTTDCAIVFHTQDIVVHPSQYLRGYEQWFMDFVLNPGLIEYLLDTINELRIAVMVNALKEVGDLIDVVSSSDDVADNRGPIISPSMYREFIKPRHKKYFDAIRTNTPATILYHCCGAIEKLIPDFIDLGVQAINPIQVSAGNMDNTAQLKKEYGKKVTFWGSIDNLHVLPNGSPKDVRSEVKSRVHDLAPGGGFILAAVHNIQPDVPPENIVAMFDAAREFGVYPLP